MTQDVPAPAVAPAADVREFFREQLEAARSRQGVQVREDTGAYLVELMAGFLSADRLYVQSEGRPDLEPLAFTLKRAVEAPRAQREALLRRLGDTALYVSGFFADSLQSGLVDVDYYASMGGRAYGVLGDSTPRRAAAAVFRELAEKFLKIADLLGEIGERSSIGSDAGVLRLYERWVRTGSERLRVLLVAKGVVPSGAR